MPWRVSWREVDGRQRNQSFPTEAAAKAHRSQLETDLGAGSYIAVDRGALTVEAWADECERSVFLDVRPSTATRTRQVLDAQVLPAFGDMRLDEVTRDDVQSWVAELTPQYAPATVHKAWQTLSKVFNAALGTRVKVNPCAGVKLPPIPRHVARFLTVDEVHDLADAHGPDYRALVFVGAVGGLRAGELFGLSWRHVHKGHVDVLQSVKEYGGTLALGETKTARSRRRVPLPAEVMDELNAHRRRYALRGFDVDGDAPVFPAPGGARMRPTNFRNRTWKPATERVGLAPLVIHELRHTAVSLWIAAGATPNEVAARAGHTSVSVVLDRYGHLYDHSSGAVTDRLGAMLRRDGADNVVPLRPTGEA